jgi:hypothetical protein
MQFNTKASFANEIIINHNNNSISSTTNIKILGRVIENSLSWKAHVLHLMPKLSKACYVMRVTKPIMSTETLKAVYYSYFHSLITYGIIFWGNSSYSLQIFRIPKRIIRIVCGLRPTDSCSASFKNLKILPLQSQYIFSLLLFVVNNMDLYHTISQIHGISTRRNFDLYQPQSNLTTYQ